MVEQRPEKPCVAGSIPALSTFLMYYTYIIESESSGKLYIGQTQDLVERLQRHNFKRNVSTKNRGPWKMIFHKEFKTRTEAIIFEKKLKSLKNKEYLLKKIETSEL